MDNDAETIDWGLLARYVTGNVTPAEAQAAERWLEADPRHRAALDELRAVWAATRGETRGWDADRAVAKLRARVEASTPIRSRETRNHIAPRPSALAAPSRAPRRHWWIAAAAGIAAVLATVMLFRTAPWEASTPPVASAPSVTDVRTQRGEQWHARLPDGTRVRIAAASVLRFDSDFGVSHRTVELDGEAFFEAAHEGPGTFQVRTADGVVRDVGTAFVVRARPAASTQVVVTDGSVVLRARGTADAAADSLVLEARQLGRVLPTGELEFVPSVDPAAYLAWTRGQLTFEDAPLDDVVQELRRWYDDDEVRVADTRVAQRRFSGSFTRASLEDAVNIIAAVADVSVRRVDGAWVFE